MFQFQHITLVQYKNYKSASFTFDQRIVAICGPNGLGKTNLLDAIYYLCFTKSYFAKSDQQNILNGSLGFRLEACCHLEDGDHRLLCILRENGKKEFSVDGQLYTRFSAHIGKFPAVMVAPDDVQIITGGSEERRRFLDTLLCQLDPQYLQCLLDYNRILQQRNGFLKSAAESSRRDLALLDAYDAQLETTGTLIFEQRREFMKKLIPMIFDFYAKIAGRPEPLRIEYQSQLLDGPFHQLLRESRERDLLLQRTLRGIHKDEILLCLETQLFRNMASQGQRKSLLFALKLAEFQLLKDNLGFSPILLLDDVFEKLDTDRMHNLLRWICAENNGQLFVTDTDPERIRLQLLEIGVRCQLIELT